MKSRHQTFRHSPEVFRWEYLSNWKKILVILKPVMCLRGGGPVGPRLIGVPCDASWKPCRDASPTSWRWRWPGCILIGVRLLPPPPHRRRLMLPAPNGAHACVFTRSFGVLYISRSRWVTWRRLHPSACRRAKGAHRLWEAAVFQAGRPLPWVPLKRLLNEG